MTEFWKDKKVLVTGATGLIGSCLVEELIKHQAYVVALVRDYDPQSLLYKTGLINSVHIVNSSLEEFSSLLRILNKHDIDTVFHLGAQTIVQRAYRHPLDTFESNVRGTYNLLEACRQLPSLVKRIVVASSDKAYGSSTVLPYVEEMPLNGRHPYDVSKSCTDLIALSYFHTYQLPVTISRCGNVYGQGDLNWSRLIPGTIRSFLFNESPIVRSNGLFTRDYVYVKDIVHGYLRLGETTEKKEVCGQPFNFSPGRPYTVLEIIEQIQQIMNCPHLTPQILNEAHTEIEDQFLNSQKANELLHWSPLYSLEEGLKKTIEWYAAYFETGVTV